MFPYINDYQHLRQVEFERARVKREFRAAQNTRLPQQLRLITSKLAKLVSQKNARRTNRRIGSAASAVRS